MNKDFKPKGYNSVSPYFIVDGAEKFMEMLTAIFNASALRKYEMPDGSIMHAEMQIDDSVIMLGNSSEKFPPVPIVMHVYVRDVDAVFDKAIKYGCILKEKPGQKAGDPDRRGTFEDFAGNLWSIGTQIL